MGLAAKVLVVLVGLCASTAWGETPLPLGAEFQINTYTTNEQQSSSVAAAPNGDFIVVWESYGSSGADTRSLSVQGQRYDAMGIPIGGQFQVNAYTTNTQGGPSVAIAADGDFIVVWDSIGSYGSDNSFFSVQGQIFDSEGTAVGSQFQVNTYAGAAQRAGERAVAANGSYFVVWQTWHSSSATDHWGVQAQRFDPAGAPIGGEFLVNTYTTEAQYRPSVMASADGEFVVAWVLPGQETPLLIHNY